MEPTDLITALQSAQAYPEPPGERIDVLQTHISMLFFVDDRVYKVKKAIKLDFLDYSTIDKRRHFCEEEVRLNRRLASDVYLGVVPVVRDEEGVIRISGRGETIEYAVEMVRLPENRMMNALLDRGEIDNAQLSGIVQLLVCFHRTAATGPGVDKFGRFEEVKKQVETNIQELNAFVSRDANAIEVPTVSLICTILDHVRVFARQWLVEHRPLLEQRVNDGRIREGHGDLHTGNICLTDDGIVVYDCIEFARRFRCCDVASELAFLAMDLDRRCFRGFAGYLLQRYAEQTDDPKLPSVAEFYKLHFALVRGKVALLRAADHQVGSEERDRARSEAMRYFHLAAAYALPPAMILMCGLPATGKSTAAQAIARPFEAVILRSDVVRKELAGLAPRPHADADVDSGIYAPDHTQCTYAALLQRARDHLQLRKTVVVDATFPTQAMRRPFFVAARDLGVDCVLVELTCPEDVVRERLRERAIDRAEVSDADWDVYQHARARFESPIVSPELHVRCDARHSLEQLVGTVLNRLIHLSTR